MFNPTRRGIPFFYDFYATSMLWDQQDQDHLFIVKTVFEHTRKVLLFDVACCVFSELEHQNNRSDHKAYYPIRSNEGWTGSYFNSKSKFTNSKKKKCIAAQFIRQQGFRRFFTAAKRAFCESEWQRLYGGPAWGEICQRALSMMEWKDEKDLMVKIDMVIDSAHNTGRCLDKLYPRINEFLTAKTRGKIDNEIVARAQRFVRHMAT